MEKIQEPKQQSLIDNAEPHSYPGPKSDINSEMNSATKSTTQELSGSPENPEATSVAPAKRDWRFWALLVSLSLAGLLTALEATITSTALPSVIAELGGGHLYIWVVNGYLFAV